MIGFAPAVLVIQLPENCREKLQGLTSSCAVLLLAAAPGAKFGKAECKDKKPISRSIILLRKCCHIFQHKYMVYQFALLQNACSALAPNRGAHCRTRAGGALGGTELKAGRRV